MVEWECPTKPREASGLDPEAVHGTGSLLALSLVAAVPGLVGVAAGKRARGLLSERRQELLVYGLLTIVGAKLLADGLGIL